MECDRVGVQAIILDNDRKFFPLVTPKVVSKDGEEIFSTTSRWKSLVMDWNLLPKFDVFPMRSPRIFPSALSKDVKMELD